MREEEVTTLIWVKGHPKLTKYCQQRHNNKQHYLHKHTLHKETKATNWHLCTLREAVQPTTNAVSPAKRMHGTEQDSCLDQSPSITVPEGRAGEQAKRCSPRLHPLWRREKETRWRGRRNAHVKEEKDLVSDLTHFTSVCNIALFLSYCLHSCTISHT